jgi:hypothetical protein
MAMAAERSQGLDLPAPQPKDGTEPIQGTSHTLGDFWRWYASNFGSNTLRGNLAEFMVARALGDQREVQVEWSPYDIETPDGTRVEVKSSAYLQGWHQERPSRIEFQPVQGAGMGRGCRGLVQRSARREGRRVRLRCGDVPGPG